MKNRLIACAVVVSALLLCVAAQPKDTTAPPVDDPLQSVVPYIGGEWRINGAWSDGRAIKARETFEWGVGKKFIVCKTFVAKPDGGEYQRYETIFGAQDGKLMVWVFTFDGHTESGPWQIDGKKLFGTRQLHAADGSSGGTVHQSIELVEPNKFRWLVAIEKDGKTDQVIDGVWERTTTSVSR
ncbi:MAG: hypothetical protein ACREJC_16935 [Tepidisphaeraceae bacterium]